MKKVKLLLLTFLLTAILPLAVYAKDTGRIILEKKGDAANSADVSLALPEGSAADVTSLRFKLYVTAEDGKINAPTFSFAVPENSKTAARASITGPDSSDSYLIDLIIARPEPIFAAGLSDADGNLTAKIGTITVSAANLNGTLSGYTVEIGAADEYVLPEENGTADNESVPILEYVNQGGVQSQKLYLTDSQPILLQRAAQTAPETEPEPEPEPNPGNPGTPGGGNTTPGGDNTNPGGGNTTPGGGDNTNPGGGNSTPGGDNTNPGGSGNTTPGGGNTNPGGGNNNGSGNENPGTDIPSDEEFQRLVPSLKAKAKSKRSDEIKISWTKIGGADGYEIYRFNSKTKAYEWFLTINDGNTLTHTVAVGYNQTTQLALRAFRTLDDGSREYSAYSNDATAMTYESPLAAPKLTVKNIAGTRNIRLSWNSVEGADGYRIYQYNAKKGGYTKVKTIVNAEANSYTIKGSFGKRYTYAVRAFRILDEDKSKQFGKYSADRSVKVTKFDKTVKPASVKVSAPENRKSFSFSWKKVAGADGYQIYRYDSAKKKYVLLTTVKGGGRTSVSTGKNYNYGQSYSFKVRAYVMDGKTKVYSRFSSKVSVKTPEAESTVGKPFTKLHPLYVEGTGLSGGKRISFKWDKVDGADGYQIYRYNSAKKTYTRFMTVKGGKKTSAVSGKKFSYGESAKFKLRAYQSNGGSVSYSRFSSSFTVQMPPKKVERVGLAAKAAGYVMVSWSKVKGADGYQIYRSTSKNGTYEHLGTVESPKLSFKDNTPNYKTVYYYKVRAYCEDSFGEKITGEYSRVKSVRGK